MKLFRLFFATILLTLMLFFTSFAGEWQQDLHGWKYLNDDGSCLKSCWAWLDYDNDGIAECYYFDESGYCLINVQTPDGYLVDSKGAWVLDGVVQYKTLNTGTTTTKEDLSQGNSSTSTGTGNTTRSETTTSEPTSISNTVYWTPSGEKYHSTENCSTLKRSKTIYSGTKSQAGNREACKVCY